MSIAHKMSEFLSPMNEEVLGKLSAILTRKELKKNELLLKEGQICRHISFVESGLIRHFYYKNEKEITVHFIKENEFSVCMESFLKHTPTYLYVEALEPTVIYMMPYVEFMELVKEYYEIGKLYQRMLELLFFDVQYKIDSLRFEGALERYERFRAKDNGLIKRVPLVHIASYLLMSPETLSRVRSISPEKEQG